MDSTNIPQLDGRNWREWFFKMKNHLKYYKLWDVTSKELKEEEKDPDTKEKIEQAQCIIQSCINAEYIGHISECTSAYQVWNTLMNLYQETGNLREQELRLQLSRLRKQPEQNIDQYINEHIGILDELRQIGVHISAREAANTILNGLPSEFNTVITVLAHFQGELTISQVRKSLKFEESKLTQGNSYVASLKPGQKSNKTEKVKCQYCNKPGHILSECRKFVADYGPPPSKSSEQGKSNNQDQKDEEKQVISLMASTIELTTDDEQIWIIDSGASWHMTGIRSFFDLNTIKKHRIKIEIADGSCLMSEEIGKIELILGDSKGTKVVLNNVLYVPGLTANLLSVSSMTSMKASITFTPYKCIIKKEEQQIEIQSKRDNHYCLKATAKTWHERLGHVHSSRIKKLNLPHKMDQVCESCATNKQTTQKFKPKNYDYRPLDLVYMDVVGEIRPETPGGYTFYLSVLDHATKYGLVYLMNSKGQAGKYAKQAINHLEKIVQSNFKVKSIRTDRGQEFQGSDLKQFLSEKGILHELTAGYTPQQNDAERFHRDIREHAGTMLNNSKLPNKYWGEAVKNYAYTRNFVPGSNTEEKQTPFEKLCGKTQSINHLRVFGCRAWIMKNPKQILGKFDTRSEKGIFLGYENSSTYRVLVRNTMVISRNVRFDEEVMEEYIPTTYETRVGMACPENNPSMLQWETASQESISESQELNPDEIGDNPNDSHDIQEEEMNHDPVELCPNSPRYNLRPNRKTNFSAYNANELPDKFDGYDRAMKRPDHECWKEAILTEISSLNNMRTWTITDLPKERKPIGSKWIFRIKRDTNNNIIKYKARLVALGCHQKPGEDYEDIYASVVSKTGLRIFLAAVNQLNLHLHQMDIETAFLNANLEEEVYLRVPKGFPDPEDQSKVLKLDKSLYGLKQAPRAWNQELTRTLNELNFTCNQVDQNVLKCEKTDKLCFLCFYVDDILIASDNVETINTMKNLIKSRYKAVDCGEAHHFLGITIERNRDHKILTMDQMNKVNGYIKEHGIEDSKPNHLPLSVPLENHEDKEQINHTQYQKISGQLQYLAGTTRPDICHAASALARYNARPTQEHWNAIRGTLKYLNGTRNVKIIYRGTTENIKENIQIDVYSDADYGGETDTRRSRTGYAIVLMGSLVSWQSKLQPTIALSTTEAEYQATTSAVKEVLWIKNFLDQLINPKNISINVYVDNQSALHLLKNPQSISRTKHIDVQHHFLRERAMRSEVSFIFCPSEEMWADYLTKRLNKEKFKKCISNLGISSA